MQKLDVLHTGKAKTAFTTADPDVLIMEYRNDTSAFDGKKLEQLDRKGSVNNKFNAFIMEYLAKQGVPTHHISLISDNQSLVKRLQMLPVECVVRNRAAGSICRRLGLEEGQVFATPIFEFFYKDDSLGDPMINDCHVLAFGWATESQMAAMKALSLRVNELLSQLFDAAGLHLVDYKLEFGVYKGEILLADEFSPDGCRLWDKNTLEKMDKDRFRQGLGNVIEYYEEVARRLGVPL